MKKILLLTSLIHWSILSFSPQQDQSVRKAISENLHRISPCSLNKCGYCVYSQYSENGIVEEIFKRLNIYNGFFVKFGANDGIFCSNTGFLWEKDWKGVMIESNLDRFANLKYNYRNCPNVLVLNEFVTWNREDFRGRFFDEIKNEFFADQEIDFLSIDVDERCDFFILKTLLCRPKVICIENGLKWHPLLDLEAPEKIAKNNLHQPFKIVIDYARSTDYEPICSTNNLFLVRKEYHHLFRDVPSDSLTLWRDVFRVFPNRQYWIDCRKYIPEIKLRSIYKKRL